MSNRHEKHKATVEARKGEEQALLLEQLKKLPIVSAACEKTGISRPTYYRWRQEDPEFAKAADESIEHGTLLVNDMAEGQLLTAIRNGNLGAVMYWLKHRNANYNNKLEVTARIKQDSDTLTPEQEAAITEALRLASISDDDISLPSPPSHEQGESPSAETPAADAA